MKFVKIILICFLAVNIGSLYAQSKINEVPNWAKEAIWYQIFPERFANGDQSNDPKAIDMEGAWPYFTPEGWQIHPWTSDWYKLQPWEEKLKKNFYDIVNIRRYGGDLQGVIDKLDYLKSLGITAIYLNPIFESPSLHKYDASFYHHVDNNFGPDPMGDREIWEKENHADPSTWQWTSADRLFLKLINEVHARGMKIIIDGVFNHTGTQFWAFKDIVKNQGKSEFKDWFVINKLDDPLTPENEFDYSGWVGVKDLPELKENENGLVEGPSEHIHAVIKRWMDPNGDGDPSDGIDGWRLDVAEMVNHYFWKQFRTWIREINPEAYTVGEVWWEDWSKYKMFNAAPWLKGDQFDAVMNYRFTRAVKDFALANKVKIDAKTFADTINIAMKQYKENFFVMMNLLGSHDTERLGSLAVNPDGQYDHAGNFRDNKNFEIRKPNEVELKRIKLATLIQFTMPGAPHIYNGDEVGMWGGDDPDCRKPMIWKEYNYESENTNPFGLSDRNDIVKVDDDLLKWHQTIAKIRSSEKVLAHGDLEFFSLPDNNEILVYKRFMGTIKIIVIANGSSQKVTFSLNEKMLHGDSKQFIDLLSNNTINVNEKGLTITLNAYEGIILK